MDKWQIRQAQDFARDNKVPYSAALKELFPERTAEIEQAQAEEQAAAGEQAPADAGEQAQAPAKAAASK